jgi:hypothetical protein
LNRIEFAGKSMATPIVDPIGDPDCAVVVTVPEFDVTALTNAPIAVVPTVLFARTVAVPNS